MKYLRGQCLVFGVASLVLGSLAYITWGVDMIRFAILSVMTALCFLAFGWGVYQLSQPVPSAAASSTGAFTCRHCARSFPTQRIRDGHEHICPEMKV